MQDTDHFVRAGELGDKVVQTGVIGDRTANKAPGFIGMIAGFMVYETPHIAVDRVDGGKFLQFGEGGDGDSLTLLPGAATRRPTQGPSWAGL